MAEVRLNHRGFNEGVRAGMFTVPGDGRIDFRPLAGFVRGSGYRSWLVVEAEQDRGRAPPNSAVFIGIGQ
jgi:inosose dehydratase